MAKKTVKTRETKKGRNYLWALRLKAGHDNVKDLCKILGIGASMVYEMEKGTREPSSKLASKMASVYNCTMDEIYNRKPAKNRTTI
jgi:DNA-binding XRE family transcriptional regulator